jgi:hypothetical protein
MHCRPISKSALYCYTKIHVSHACNLFHSQYMPKLCFPPFPCKDLPSTKEHVLTNFSDYRCSFCPENTFFYLCTCCISLFMSSPFCKSLTSVRLPLRIFILHASNLSSLHIFISMHPLSTTAAYHYTLHCKKRLSFFPSIFPGQGEFS